MRGAPSPLDRLDELERALNCAATAGSDLSAQLLADLHRYRAASGELKLDRALGLVEAARGGWWTQARLRRRNELIHEAAKNYSRDPCKAADAMIADVRRLQRTQGVIPPRLAKLSEALLTGAKFPGRRQLIEIIKDGVQ
jgi:hypothetical protein